MAKFEIYKGEDKGSQCWRWRLIDDNGANIARSEEAFSSEESILVSVKNIKANVSSNTPIFLDNCPEEDGRVWRFEYFEGGGKQPWYWRLRAGNSEPMAIGGEGFVSKDSVLGSIENVRKEMQNAVWAFLDPSQDPTKGSKEAEEGTKVVGRPGSRE